MVGSIVLLVYKRCVATFKYHDRLSLIMNLSELIAKSQGVSLPPGPMAGTCMFCGNVGLGHTPEISDSFTNANICSGGAVICPNCNYINRAEIPGAKQSAGKLYRSNMWYATEKGVGVIRFPKKDLKEGGSGPRDISEIFRLPERTPRSILVDPPEPPFAIFLTRSWKKPGWQTMLRANGGVSTSRDLFLVGFDYEVIYLDRAKLHLDLAYIDVLRADPAKPGKILLTKGELESGKISAGGVARMIDAEMDVAAIVSDLRKRANDPGWGLAVYVA
jgi:hypothetical protein